MADKKKRKRGDRRDGRWIKGTGLQTIMSVLLPNRTDCEVYLHETIDCTEILKYLEAQNVGREKDERMTLFHCIVTGVARMVKERPIMNRFIAGTRCYERDEISLAFVAKRRFTDHAEEALMFIFAKDDDTVHTISKKIIGDVREARKTEHSSGGIDEVVDKFAGIPRPLLIPVIKIIRILDFWGLNPKALTDGDPNYASVFMSNLGSIKCPSVYHHLNNYGTNSIFLTIGTIHKEEMLMPDGTKQIRDVVDIGATLDERIGDGFYFARSLKLIKHIFANPELLEKPIGENSGFDYK